MGGAEKRDFDPELGRLIEVGRQENLKELSRQWGNSIGTLSPAWWSAWWKAHGSPDGKPIKLWLD